MDGLPLLSFPPPDPPNIDESNCRKCSKEFNFLFTRPKRCQHCGYSYCSSCADYQALMPRGNAHNRGYDPHTVCAFCMEMLSITASSRNRLRDLPVSKLRAYTKAYNISAGETAVEKDDLVNAILDAKGLDGCLHRQHEDYYRQNSVPQGGMRSRGLFSRSNRSQERSTPPQPQRQYNPPPGPPPPPPHNIPPHRQQFSPPPFRPPPNYVPPQRTHVPPRPPTYVPPQRTHAPRPTTTHVPPQRPQSQYPPPSSGYRPYHANTPNNVRPSASQSNLHTHVPPRPPQQQSVPTPPPRSRSAAPTAAQHTTISPPVPNLDLLLQKSPEEIARLPISTLKSVLFDNRVRTIGALEKDDLVQKVYTLVADERLDRAAKEREGREEAERMEWAHQERLREEEQRKADQRERQDMGTDKPDVMPIPGPSPPSFSTDRTQDGLCVVCQDEHANMAIIDCGHLALCKGCSEIIMSSTRECPLCRTRIVTEQRLLRIFKA